VLLWHGISRCSDVRTLPPQAWPRRKAVSFLRPIHVPQANVGLGISLFADRQRYGPGTVSPPSPLTPE
jgi:hypothetical protein